LYESICAPLVPTYRGRPNGTAACPLFQVLLELHLLVEFTK